MQLKKVAEMITGESDAFRKRRKSKQKLNKVRIYEDAEIHLLQECKSPFSNVQIVDTY